MCRWATRTQRASRLPCGLLLHFWQPRRGAVHVCTRFILPSGLYYERRNALLGGVVLRGGDGARGALHVRTRVDLSRVGNV